jgi:UDP-N-acetylglucosamine acyltransferase
MTASWVTMLSLQMQLAGHVEVGDYAIIGGLSGAAQFTRVGAHTYVAGDTVINKDVPPFIKAGRTPLSFVGVNSVGLQRRGFATETINEVLEIYRNVYNKGLNISQAMDFVEQHLPGSEHRDTITKFIRESKMCIVKGSNKADSDED